MPRPSDRFILAIPQSLLLASLVCGCRHPAPGTSAPRSSAVNGSKAAVVKPEPIEARALYVTGWIAGGNKSFQRLIALIHKTPLNAVVIDVKDSDGAVSYMSDVPLAKEIMAKAGSTPQVARQRYGHRIGNIDTVLAELKRERIYPIARIAVFEDDILPRVRPELGVHRRDGSLWLNRKRQTWCSPYRKEVWDYAVSLGEEAVRKGFKEVQWDYVRFPSDGKLSEMRFPGQTKTPHPQQIAAFLKFARDRIHRAGGVMSADIFGLTVLSKTDMGIGQTIRAIAENCDYICPMVYPSHYHKGEYGISNPDRAPYKIVFVSLRDGKKRIAGTKCKIRPWLQNFNLQSKYGASDIWAQIKAARDNDIHEFLLWDPNDRFTHTAEAFKLMAADEVKEKTQKHAVEARAPTSRPSPTKAG